MIETFQRFEKKYLLSPDAYANLQDCLISRLVPDAYGKYTVCNLYYDTSDYRLIRTSLEKPVYKEKLRLRSYGIPSGNDPVFLELKKKYAGVVYKRRAALTLDAMCQGSYDGSQVLNEIGWFMRFHGSPIPRVYLAYDREAFLVPEEPELRITFDRNIRWRQSLLDLSRGSWGNTLLSGDKVLMEVKAPRALPVWLCHMLSENGIYPTTFSKYGVCYQTCLAYQKEDGNCA